MKKGQIDPKIVFTTQALKIGPKLELEIQFFVF